MGGYGIIGVIIEIALGALAGYIGTQLMGGKKNSWLFNIILGILGSVVGGWIASIIGLGGGLLVQLLIAIGGACLLIWLARKLGISDK